MLKKRTRRILAIVLLVTITSPLPAITKLLFCIPIIFTLLGDWNEYITQLRISLAITCHDIERDRKEAEHYEKRI